MPKKSLQQLLQELDDVYFKCSKKNWDGYKAKPANKSLRFAVEKLLLGLPPDIPNPNISCDPDGEISLEWFRAKDRVFSISIGEKWVASYVVLDRASRFRGTETFSTGSIPPVLLFVLRQFWKGEI